MGLVMVLYVMSIVCFCLPHVVEVSALCKNYVVFCVLLLSSFSVCQLWCKMTPGIFVDHHF